MSAHLFLASKPDADAAARIHRMAEVVKCARLFDGALIGTDRLHVTLFFLDGGSGSVERILRMACEAAQEVLMPPFEVSFDRVASFRGRPDRHPFVLLGGDGLRRLRLFRQTLGAAMVRKGLRHLVNKEFTPHVTLLYDKRHVEEQPIEPIFWTVGEFVLIHSMYGHTHLARWPLRVE
jgi:2'-5' RNA ligase